LAQKPGLNISSGPFALIPYGHTVRVQLNTPACLFFIQKLQATKSLNNDYGKKQANMTCGELMVAIVMLVLVSNIAICNDYAWIVYSCACLPKCVIL
jgi:hypothetical protein